ncbi:chemotaxis protein CheD [Planctomicrobium piriforme]|uniref:Probable chemoreceptor glutamine deamidase CheD n=2 Tax=Planctomicrobium piriforme TaxID=1576369 RepID=A0A1I3CJN6_9PLAN|nr:chemotaxis protein CheD [Planctomicrobium piriforme]
MIDGGERLQLVTTGEAVVKIGELGLAGGAGVLRTLLGSCIGLCVYDRQRRIGGLAHIVLPDSHGRQDSLGKYADTAVPELIRQITLAGGRAGSLNAKIAGGADMFAAAKTMTVGSQNRTAVLACLKLRDIPVLKDHCGGEQGRRMYFFPETGRVRIEIVGQEPVDL